mmetsp:Transcript_579/g.1081  ORF Transcript_579/g.1081 Transcript_579/m.1081 type:complete len:390 (-) Transcript_579:455-1624(-)
MTSDVQKKRDLWKEMQPLLGQENYKNGIEIKVLYQNLNPHKYSVSLIRQFVSEMHETHRMIAYLPTDPLQIKMRRPAHVHQLKKLDDEQYKVYNHIERSGVEGILMSRLSKAAAMSSAKCTSIIRKLEKEKLTDTFTNPRTYQKFYCVTSNNEQPLMRTEDEDAFRDGRGKIDEEWLSTVINVVLHQIKICDAVTGISAAQIQRIIKDSQLTKDNKGLPLTAIELVLQILLYEKKTDLIASSIPREGLEKFITHSKNSYYHLIQNIQRIRRNENTNTNNNKRSLNELHNIGATTQPSAKRQKINDSTSNRPRIAYDGDGEEEEVVAATDESVANIEKYSDIKFKFNTFDYASPFAQIPCQSCPVSNTCSDDGKINPTECPFLNAWLELF